LHGLYKERKCINNYTCKHELCVFGIYFVSLKISPYYFFTPIIAAVTSGSQTSTATYHAQPGCTSFCPLVPSPRSYFCPGVLRWADLHLSCTAQECKGTSAVGHLWTTRVWSWCRIHYTRFLEAPLRSRTSCIDNKPDNVLLLWFYTHFLFTPSSIALKIKFRFQRGYVTYSTRSCL
jgi:hypothetical protein